MTTEKEKFVWHQDIASAMLNGFNVRIKDVNLIKGGSLTEGPWLGHKTYRSFHRVGHLCFRLVAQIKSNSPVADCWVFTSWGHTADDRPLFDREILDLIVGDNDVITIDDPEQGHTVTHGQGILKHFSYDFSQSTVVERKEIHTIRTEPVGPWFVQQALPSWLDKKENEIPIDWISRLVHAVNNTRRGDNKNYEPFEESRYTPAFPGRTGGQTQFGCDILAPEHYIGKLDLTTWRKQLYQEACRPSALLHPDGSRTTADQWPGTIWSDRFDGRANSNGWITYSDSLNTWKDKVTGTTKWHDWNPQHWSIGALCQVYAETRDLGLEMILNDLVEVWLWSTPVVDKGTTHHKGGAARAHGREIEAGANLFYALPNHQERIKLRLTTLLEIQVKEYKEQVEEHGHGIIFRNDGFAIWEHGLWVKGLIAGYSVLDNGDLKNDVVDMAVKVSQFVLDGFKWWEEDKEWGIPFLIDYDLKTWSDSPSYGLSMWCLPCLQILEKYGTFSLNSEDLTKLQTIISQLTTHAEPYDGSWPDDYKWRLY